MCQGPLWACFWWRTPQCLAGGCTAFWNMRKTTLLLLAAQAHAHHVSPSIPMKTPHWRHVVRESREHVHYLPATCAKYNCCGKVQKRTKTKWVSGDVVVGRSATCSNCRLLWRKPMNAGRCCCLLRTSAASRSCSHESTWFSNAGGNIYGTGTRLIS